MSVWMLPWCFLVGVAIGALIERWREEDRVRREFVRTFTRPPTCTQAPTTAELPTPEFADEFGPYLREALKNPAVRTAYEAERDQP